MKRNLRMLRAVLWLAAILSFATAARAAEAAQSAADGGSVLLFKWIHFLIVAVVLVWLFRKVLPPIFRRKADIISDKEAGAR